MKLVIHNKTIKNLFKQILNSIRMNTKIIKTLLMMFIKPSLINPLLPVWRIKRVINKKIKIVTPPIHQIIIT